MPRQPLNHEAGGSSAQKDRRSFPRRKSPASVRISRCEPVTPIDPEARAWQLHASQLTGLVIDVSMNGLAFCLDEPMGQDQTILLRLSNPTSGTDVDVTGRIRRVFQKEAGWTIACQFQTKLTLEQIEALAHYSFATDIV